ALLEATPTPAPSAAPWTEPTVDSPLSSTAETEGDATRSGKATPASRAPRVDLGATTENDEQASAERPVVPGAPRAAGLTAAERRLFSLVLGGRPRSGERAAGDSSAPSSEPGTADLASA